MNKGNIGTNAGILYHLLCDRAHWSYESLKKRSQLSDMDISAALGWLARENKVEFEPTPDGFKVFLNFNYYF